MTLLPPHDHQLPHEEAEENTLLEMMADIFLESYLKPATIQTDSTVE